MIQKITYDEVRKLLSAIPCRQPRGDPRNLERSKLEMAFYRGVIRYYDEHGRDWFEETPESGVKPG